MQAATRTIETDVCVVGAGIVGLAHALEARRRGLNVVVLDRDDRAAGASVRNFGHLFFTSVDGSMLRCAEIARERWLEFGAKARIFMANAGTLIVARHGDELAVLEPVAQDPARHARMLSAREVGALAPIPTDDIVGGFHATQDLRVDPRAAVAGFANLLTRDDGARIEWGTHVHEVEVGLVRAGRLQVRAPAIVVCPGAGYRSLPPVLRRGLMPLTLCQMQMLRLVAPTGRRYQPALATGLSLIRYPAFAAQPSAAELRARLELEKGELIDRGVKLLVTQLPDGDLIVGDTHTYADTPAPFGDERLYRLLLDEARALLGIEPEVRQRWHGTYPALRSPDPGDFHITAPLPGVRVVQNISGIGMTLSFGQAPAVLDDLLSGQDTSANPTPARGNAALL
ncbi:MAG TPA: TIGR03364 family FAD-dependent oxidoreductase [Solirubrobacteraceae bacterium]|nr:TIGR03364 family FAD-dependent oxidoreductase [Solirubrobacteraceae bacterium]